MKITDKIISIPPYISTSWDKVISLFMKDRELIFVLKDNTLVAIPNLSSDIIEEIFSAHASFLENQLISKEKTTLPNQPQEPSSTTDASTSLPFRLFFGTLDSINQALQHNPENHDLPALPQDIINKIEMLSKAVPKEDIGNLPNPETGCNCIYCQMMRILKKDSEPSSRDSLQDLTEEEVSDEELRFEQWNVRPIGDKIYIVINKLDNSEEYRVFLGDPIGCTCGKPNCEHIVAVLRH